jgi:hypothetical protein
MAAILQLSKAIGILTGLISGKGGHFENEQYQFLPRFGLVCWPRVLIIEIHCIEKAKLVLSTGLF